MYDCVIPAAGESSRMGEWKPGLPFRGGTILSATVEAALAAGCRVLLIAGNRAESISAALGRALSPRPKGSVEIVFNPDWQRGMMGSLQAGMIHVESPWFFVLPADMPLVPARVFLDLSREAGIRDAEGLPAAPVFPLFQGVPGHPVLIPSSLIREALSLPKGSRFKDFLAVRNPVHLFVADSGIRKDVDTLSDYEKVSAGIGL
jgi:molybdenum cofactor cytidylyltransferase